MRKERYRAQNAAFLWLFARTLYPMAAGMKKQRLFWCLFALSLVLCAHRAAGAAEAGGFLQMTIISGADRIQELYREFTAYPPAQREALWEERRQAERDLGRKLFFDRTVFRGASTAEALHHALAFKADPAVAAYVQQKQQDPAIRKTVEEDALDAEIWWQWFGLLPVDHETHLSQRAVLEWVENYMTIPKEDRAFLSYNLMRISQETLDAYTDSSYAPPPVFEAPDFEKSLPDTVSPAPFES